MVKVIGVGLFKTSTYSVKSALEILYPGQTCFHFKEHVNERSKFWIDLIENEDKYSEEKKVAMIRQAYKDIPFCMDAPVSLFYKEFYKAFPDALFILTVRNTDSWIKSVKSHYEFLHSIRIPIRVVLALRFPFVLDGKFQNARFKDFNAILDYCNFRGLGCMPDAYDADTLIKKYDEQFSGVTKLIPKEKLLLYDVRQSWAPLCRFLNLDIPNGHIPRENVNNGHAKSQMGNLDKIYMTLALIVAILAMVMVCLATSTVHQLVS